MTAGARAPVTERRPGLLVRTPWWVQVLVVALLARGWSTGVLVAVSRSQEANLWTEAAPPYLDYVGLMWDATWYRTIAEDGYPAGLPTGDDGSVRQNAWAFFPLFPALARAMMAVTGAPWAVVAPLLATVLGLAAMLVLHRLMTAVVEEHALPPMLPIATVALVATAAASPVLQVAYTESLALLLVVTALLLLVRRRYALAVPVVLALGLTRAVALPLLLAVVLHALRADGRWGRAWRPGEGRTLALLTATTAASGLLWPVVVGVATGVPDAYTRTQAAWRGAGEVVPLKPWIDVPQWLWGTEGLLGVLALLAGVAAFVTVGPVRRLGPEVQGWTAGYLGYLVLVLEPQTSLVRFLLLAVGLQGGLALLASRLPGVAARWAGVAFMVAVGCAAQVLWVWELWRLVPPSGWPP